MKYIEIFHFTCEHVSHVMIFNMFSLFCFAQTVEGGLRPLVPGLLHGVEEQRLLRIRHGGGRGQIFPRPSEIGQLVGSRSLIWSRRFVGTRLVGSRLFGSRLRSPAPAVERRSWKGQGSVQHEADGARRTGRPGPAGKAEEGHGADRGQHRDDADGDGDGEPDVIKRCLGVWMGTLADKIDERLHHQMVQNITIVMWELISTSRLLPPRPAPDPAVSDAPLAQPTLPQQQQQQQLQQQQHNKQQQQPLQHDVTQGAGTTTTFTDMIPPLLPLQHRGRYGGAQQSSDHGQQSSDHGQQSSDHGQQSQSQSQFQSQSQSGYAFPNWDAPGPTAGQVTYTIPTRPSSTPNMSQTSQSSLANLSGMTDMLGLNTPQNMTQHSPSDNPPAATTNPGMSGAGFL